MVFGHGFGLELAQRPFETTFSSRNSFRSRPHLQGGPKPPLIDWPLFPAHKGRECAELEERGPVHLVGTNQGSVDWFHPGLQVSELGPRPPISPIWHGERSLAVSPRIAAALASTQTGRPHG